MGLQSPMRNFQCRACGCLDIQVTGRLSANAPVRCARCDTVITTWRAFVEGLRLPPPTISVSALGTRYLRQ